MKPENKTITIEIWGGFHNQLIPIRIKVTGGDMNQLSDTLNSKEVLAADNARLREGIKALKEELAEVREDISRLRDVSRCAFALLNNLNNMTTEDFSRGSDKVFRDRLQSALDATQIAEEE